MESLKLTVIKHLMRSFEQNANLMRAGLTTEFGRDFLMKVAGHEYTILRCCDYCSALESYDRGRFVFVSLCDTCNKYVCSRNCGTYLSTIEEDDCCVICMRCNKYFACYNCHNTRPESFGTCHDCEKIVCVKCRGRHNCAN